ncbi:CU044_2847 family protein [Micromonospora zamorensis]|uniref:CU044_2847 family protein n=1 Tax=Micromonospora zamorensis TaxID=709883 RepID=UPI0012FE3525|nr:CU044_2847 family protein [Micromonospora zamorensis]
MIEPGETSSQNRAVLVEVQLDDHTLFMLSEDVGQPSRIGHEVEIAGQCPSLDGALDAVAELAQKISSKLQDEQMSKITVEFGCEFAVNSGSFVAVIGKASAKSAFKVTLEWSRPEG